MLIDLAAILSPIQESDTITPAVAPSITNEGGAAAGVEVGNDADHEAWNERAAIIEFEGGQDRQIAEALASAEASGNKRATALPERAGEDRRYCRECGHYRGVVCTIAKPGGVLSARRGYAPVSDLLCRCNGFAPLANDTDRRNGLDRVAWLHQLEASERP